MTPAGLPHSDTPGSQLGCQLPRAYRRLQRPSSALDAKASTMCPSQLVSQTLNKNHKDTQPHPPTINKGQGHYKKHSDNTPTPPPRHKPRGRRTRLSSDARVHYPLTKHPTHQPPTPDTTVRDRRRGHTRTPTPGRASRAPQAGLIPQGPTACQHPTPTRTTQVPHNRSEQARTGCRTEDGPPRDAGASSMTPLSEHHQCHPDIRRVRGVRAP